MPLPNLDNHLPALVAWMPQQPAAPYNQKPPAWFPISLVSFHLPVDGERGVRLKYDYEIRTLGCTIDSISKVDANRICSDKFGFSPSLCWHDDLFQESHFHSIWDFRIKSWFYLVMGFVSSLILVQS
jgi:hypothetical protein